MAKTNAGRMRETITFLIPGTPTPDGQGGHLEGTETESTTWARVEALRGTSQLALGAVATGQVYTVTVRTAGLVTPLVGWRIRWGAITMLVQTIQPTEARDLLALTCFDNGRD